MRNLSKIHYLKSTINVETKVENKGEDMEKTLTDINDQSDVPSITKDPAYVTVSAGVTRNLGNFNSAKISVSIHYPCDPAKVDETYLALKDWVDERITAEGTEIDAYLESKKAVI